MAHRRSVPQTAAAFAAVQLAFDWLVDNHTHLAEWAASSSRAVLRLWKSRPGDDRCLDLRA